MLKVRPGKATFRDHINSYNRVRVATPEGKALKAARDKRYREKYKEELRQKKVEWYARDREAQRAQMRANYLAKSEAYKERARQRKNLIKAGIQVPYTRLEIYERDQGLCFRCEELIDLNLPHPDPRCLSIHHLVPIKLGGRDIPENVAASHLECNLKQGIKLHA